jgi:uncharacterized protein (TIGR02722 family)
MKKEIIVLIGTAVIILAGCQAKTTNVDVVNDQGNAVMALDYRDFDQAASKMVQSMLASGALKKKEGGRYVAATSRVVNDTMQRIDTDQLMVKIQQELLNSGQVIMTAAVGAGGSKDTFVQDSRTLRKADEFDANTVAGKGTLIAPDLSISGKILQRNIGYSRGVQQVEYYFQLQVADLKNGLIIWQNEQPIVKRGSSRSVAW